MGRMPEKRSPNDGGCWFCNTYDDEPGWEFSFEWDAFYHLKCFKKAYLKGDGEAEVIYRNEWSSPQDRRMFKRIKV